MTVDQEREHFAQWVSVEMPFDKHCGMVEHSILTGAAWLGWMACAASRDFQELMSRETAETSSKPPREFNNEGDQIGGDDPAFYGQKAAAQQKAA